MWYWRSAGVTVLAILQQCYNGAVMESNAMLCIVKITILLLIILLLMISIFASLSWTETLLRLQSHIYYPYNSLKCQFSGLSECRSVRVSECGWNFSAWVGEARGGPQPGDKADHHHHCNSPQTQYCRILLLPLWWSGPWCSPSSSIFLSRWSRPSHTRPSVMRTHTQTVTWLEVRLTTSFQQVGALGLPLALQSSVYCSRSGLLLQ